MQNVNVWKPTKVVKEKGKWRVGPSVGVGSRYVANLQVAGYSRVLEKYGKGVGLDLGCGEVPWFEVVSEKLDQLECVDWQGCIHDLQFADKLCDLNGKIPYGDSQFDFVLAADVIEHLEQPAMMIKECSRLLKHDGVMVIFVPFMYWLHERPHDFGRYTEFMLAKWLKESGFVVEVLKPYGGGGDVAIDCGLKMLRAWPRLAAVVENTLIGMAHRRPLSSLRRRWARRMPVGYMVVGRKVWGVAGSGS